MKNRKLITILLFLTALFVWLTVMFQTRMQSSRKGSESQKAPHEAAEFGRTSANAPTASVTSVTMAWDRSAAPSPSGYKLNYGPATGSYNQVQDVGDTTTATAINLTPGLTYFFAASAYDATGAQGPFSNEVAFSVPSGPTATPGLPTPVPTAPPSPTTSPIPTASPIRTPSPTPSGVVGITLNPSTLNFTGFPGQQNVPPKTVTVTTSNGANWSAHDTATWFDAQPQSGGPSGTIITVRPNNGLAAGSYTANITFSASGLPNKTFKVSMIVSTAQPSPSASPPRTPTPAPSVTPSPSASPAPTTSPAPSASPVPLPSPTCTVCPCGNR